VKVGSTLAQPLLMRGGGPGINGPGCCRKADGRQQNQGILHPGEGSDPQTADGAHV
jgi:hypothetical protein